MYFLKAEKYPVKNMNHPPRTVTSGEIDCFLGKKPEVKSKKHYETGEPEEHVKDRCFKYDREFETFDIDDAIVQFVSQPYTNPDACWKHCSENPKCKFFTFENYDYGKFCVLQGIRETRNNGSVSGSKQCIEQSKEEA